MNISPNCWYDLSLRRLFDRIRSFEEENQYKINWVQIEKEYDQIINSKLNISQQSSQKIELSPDNSKILLHTLKANCYIFDSFNLFTRKPFCFESILPNYGHSRFSYCGEYLATSPSKGDIRISRFSNANKVLKNPEIIENSFTNFEDELGFLDKDFVKSFNPNNFESKTILNETLMWEGTHVDLECFSIQNAHVLDVNDFGFCQGQNCQFLLSVSDDKKAHFWKIY